jgi:hypothetical protein
MRRQEFAGAFSCNLAVPETSYLTSRMAVDLPSLASAKLLSRSPLGATLRSVPALEPLVGPSDVCRNALEIHVVTLLVRTRRSAAEVGRR